MSLELSALLYLNSIPPALVNYALLASDSVYALIGIAVLYSMLKKKLRGGVQAAIVLILVYTAVSAIKVSVGELRPFPSVDGVRAYDPESTPGFPSAHSAMAFAGAGLLGSPLAYVWAALIAVSRIILGVHYPHDVIAGALLGYILSKTFTSEKLSMLVSRENIFETRRKLFHAFFGMAIAFMIYFSEKGAYLPVLAFGVALSAYLSHLIKKTGTVPGFSWIIDTFERKKDLKEMPLRGNTFFLLGSLVAAALFSKEVAFASVLILAAGDAATTLVGKPFGRHKHLHNRKKSVEGTIAGIFAAYIAVAFFVSLNAALMGAVIFGVVESLDFDATGKLRLDDNLIVPLAVGIAMSIV